MSIRLKLAIICLSVALLPSLVVGVLTYRSYKASFERSRISDMKGLAELKADKVETYFASLKAGIETARLFYSVRKTLPRLTGPSAVESPAARKLLDEQLRPMQSGLGLAAIMLAGPSGKMVYSSVGLLDQDFLKDLPGPGLTAVPYGKNDVRFSGVFADKAAGGRASMLAAAPVFGLNDAFCGLVVFELDLEPVYKITSDRTGLGATGEVLLAAKEGDKAVFLSPRLDAADPSVKRSVAFGGPAGVPMQKAVRGEPGEGLSTDYRGRRVVAAWRYLPSLDWGLVAKIDEAEALYDVRRLGRLLLSVLAALAVLCGFTAFYIARYFSEPLKELSEGAKMIGAGNLDYKVGTGREDEIGQLSRAFDEMTESLKKTTASRDALNEEVRERKAAEEALRVSEMKLRSHFENSPLAVVEWNSDFVVTQWSVEAEHIFGWLKEETLGRPIAALNIIYPDDMPIVKDTMDRLTGGKEMTVVSSNRNITKSGEIVECVWYNSVLNDENGKMASVMSLVQDVTESSKAEEEKEQLVMELKRRALELDAVFNALPYLVSLHGPDGKYLRANPAIVRLFGHDPVKGSREESADCLNARYPDGRALTPENMPSARALKGETVTDVEYMITDKDGKDRTLLFNALPLKVAEHVYGAVFAQSDITELKNKEEELRRLNRTLKALNNSNQAMLRSESEQDYLDRICRIVAEDCGHPFVWIGFAEEEEGRPVRPVAQAGFSTEYFAGLKVSWADNELGRGPTGTAIRTGKPCGCGNMLEDPAYAPWREQALKRGFVSSLALPLLAGGQAFGALTIYSTKADDFSEEEIRLLTGLAEDLSYGLRTLRLRAAHKISEEDVQRLAHVGVFELDIDSKAAAWSKEVYRIYELDPEHTVTSYETFLSGVHPEDRDAIEKAYADSVRDRTRCDTALRLLMPDGRVKYVHVIAETVYDQAGRPLRSTGTVRDITEQKKAEDGLLAVRAELDRAKRLSDIGTLAATVAHELRNPLATIGMAAVNIKRKAKNPDLEKHLANIDKKVFESNQIINNLLFYSRLKPPHYERVGICDLLEESVDGSGEHLRHAVELGSNIDCLRGVFVDADPIQIKEVLNNVLNNAWDAVQTSGGKVELSAARENGFVRILVKDSGRGIDKDTLARVFDPFFTTKAKGTGLGLSVCRQIMDFHGGEIELRSEPGLGTTAEIILPERRQNVQAAQS